MERDDEVYYIEEAFIPGESDDDFQYDDVTINEDLDVQEEENLDDIIRILREENADQEARNPKLPQPEPGVTYRPEVIDDFMRNYLVRMKMWKTLDCFQHEWYELLRKGEIKDEDVRVVPDVYVKNQSLDKEIKELRSELKRCKTTISKTKDNFIKIQKERNYHRLHHRRVVQEKNKLIDDLKRLRKHYEMYEPALQMLKKKYETAMREKMLTTLERDRAFGQLTGLQATLKSMNYVHETGGTILPRSGKTPARVDGKYGGTQQRLYEARESAKLEKIPADPLDMVNLQLPRYPEDSAWPIDTRENPRLAESLPPCSHLTRPGGFRLNHTFSAHDLAVSCLKFHPIEDKLVTTSDDKTWKMWKIPSSELIMTGDGHTEWVSGADFSSDGKLLGTGSGDNTVKIWDFEAGGCVHTFEEHQHAVWACNWHHTSNFIASASLDNTSKVWDLNSLRCSHTFRGHTDSVNSVEFLVNGNALLTASADKTVSLWDCRMKICAQTFYGHIHAVNHATFNSRGDMVASCDAFGNVKLWDLKTVSPLKTIYCGPHSVNSVQFDVACSVLAMGSSDGCVRLCEISNEKMTNLTGHEDAVHSAVFDRNGDILVSGSSDCTVRIWS